MNRRSFSLFLVSLLFLFHLIHGRVKQDHVVSFHEMSEKEKLSALNSIFGKIDVDFNDQISSEELKKWISLIHNRTVDSAINTRFQFLDENKDHEVSWEEFRSVTYSETSDDFERENRTQDQFEQLKRAFVSDRKRFQVADLDQDDSLSRSEFQAFAVPELFPHMHFHMVEETIFDLDSDSDEHLSVNEYLSALLRNTHQDNSDVTSREYDYFFNHRDTNKDGKLDRNEVKEWIVPSSFDPHEAEAEYLVREADKNRDGELSWSEVEDNAAVFFNSGATNFGREIVASREEL